MAGGIDWFRWHHGCVTDPKFQLVARRAGCRLSDVIAVWAFILEKASAAEFRSNFGEIDAEAVDCLYGLDDGTTDRILAEFDARMLTADGYVVNWDKRQPKREREDDTAAERKRRQRAKAAENDTPDNATQSDVTPCHATSHQKTPRGEESREEVIPEEANASSSSAMAPTGRPREAASQVPCPYEKIVEAYHEALPSLPRVRLMDDKRKKVMRQRWVWVFRERREDGRARATNGDEALAWFRAFFERASHNDWLMGRRPSKDYPDFKADFDFLLRDSGWKAVIERTEAAA